MGSKMSKNKKQEPNPQSVQTQTSSPVACPLCSLTFPPQDLNDHLLQCQEQQMLQEQMMVSQILQQEMAEKKMESMVSGYLDIKVPMDDSMTKFMWQRVQINPKYNQFISKDVSFIRRQHFVARYVWMRHQLGVLRADGSQETRMFVIDPERVVQSSLKIMRESQGSCQIKVQMGKEKTQDAGGLTREWIAMVIKELSCGKASLFERCETSEPLLKLRSSFQKTDNIDLVDKFRLLGFIIARCLIENIALDCQFCWPLLRQIFKSDSLFELEDLFHYDEQLYRGLSFIRETTLNEEDIELCFTYETEKGSEELIEGGRFQKVNNKNKEYYLFSLLKYLFKTKEQIYTHALRSQLFRYIPKEIFTIFELYELEMLINGRPFIDLQEWKKNTQYRGQYHQKHQNVVWFWEILEQFSQEQLSNLMKFVSGSSKLSLQGFEKLSCNRGKSNKFELCPCSFIMKDHNPFPKGFTCFNRLMLPLYPVKQLQKKYLKAVVNTNFEGVFGLQ